MKSTASALDISTTIGNGRSSQPGRSAKQGHRITSEKRPWWQRSVTHVFDDMDLEMPAANTIEFDQFIKSHYNI